jgi:2-methylcitrate dehydratase PrpD
MICSFAFSVRTSNNPRSPSIIRFEEVEKIDLELGPVASTAAAIKEPKLGVEGKFSVWFLAALALAEGSVTLEKFTDEKVNDPRLVRLRKKIETRLDPRIGFGARLRLIMKDGTEHKAFLSKPKGDPENPLSFDELAAKYRNAARLAISDVAIGALIAAVKRMEEVQDMNEIVRLALKS